MTEFTDMRWPARATAGRLTELLERWVTLELYLARPEHFTTSAVAVEAPKVARALKLDPNDVVDIMLQYCADQSRESLEQMLWHLVARRVSDVPLARYQHPIEALWVPVEILSSVPAKCRDKAGACFQVFCLAGHAAGRVFNCTLPLGFCRALAYRLGFGRKLEYNDDPRELVGLQLWLHLKAAPVDAPEDRKFEFDEWAVEEVSQRRAHNTRLLGVRCRLDLDDPKYACPVGYDHPCLDCTSPCAASCAHGHKTPTLRRAVLWPNKIKSD